MDRIILKSANHSQESRPLSNPSVYNSWPDEQLNNENANDWRSRKEWGKKFPFHFLVNSRPQDPKDLLDWLRYLFTRWPISYYWPLRTLSFGALFRCFWIENVIQSLQQLGMKAKSHRFGQRRFAGHLTLWITNKILSRSLWTERKLTNFAF